MTKEEMEAAYPALCQKLADVQSDLEETQGIVEQLKDDKEALNIENDRLRQTILELKAQLYDLTAGTYLSRFV